MLGLVLVCSVLRILECHFTGQQHHLVFDWQGRACVVFFHVVAVTCRTGALISSS